VTIKAKWDKLKFEDSNTYMWVFIEGRMFVIGEAAHDQDLKDNFNKKTFYVGTNIKRRKRSAK
jgi:hypothetical protein